MELFGREWSDVQVAMFMGARHDSDVAISGGDREGNVVRVGAHDAQFDVWMCRGEPVDQRKEQRVSDRVWHRHTDSTSELAIERTNLVLHVAKMTEYFSGMANNPLACVSRSDAAAITFEEFGFEK